MFPVLVSVRTPEQLKAVYELLGDGADVKGTDTPAKPAKPVKEKAAPAAPAPATTATTATAAPAAAALSESGLKYLNDHLKGPVMELSQKDEPSMKAIVAKYGVERVSLIPEKFFPDVLQAVQEALDPGAAERKRLEAVDKSRSLI